MKDNPEGAYLRALEGPDCTCPRTISCACEQPCDCPVRPAPPCEHLLSVDHGLTAEEWAAQLTSQWPGDYAERPAPTVAVQVLSREAMVEVMAARQARGEGLRHPEDLHPEDLDHLGRTLIFTGNFRPRPDRLRVMGRVA